MFSKVSRSLAQFTLVNSVSTLLSKGGSICNCPKAFQNFCVTVTKTNKQVHSYSAPALCSSNTSKVRVGETAAKLKTAPTQSNSTSSGMSQKHLRCLILNGQLKKTCQHAKVMPQNAVHAVFVQVKTYQSKRTDQEHTRRKHIFTVCAIFLNLLCVCFGISFLLILVWLFLFSLFTFFACCYVCSLSSPFSFFAFIFSLIFASLLLVSSSSVPWICSLFFCILFHLPSFNQSNSQHKECLSTTRKTQHERVNFSARHLLFILLGLFQKRLLETSLKNSVQTGS